MVLQRWQTVFLFLGAVCMVLFTFLPFASLKNEIQIMDLYPKDFPVYLVLNLLIAALMLIAIFKYRNLKQQKKVTLLSILLICCSAVTGGFLLFGPSAPQGEVSLLWRKGDIALLLAALICGLAAYRGISKDQRTLSSYDRIR